ncbi:MAG: D-3-phosphoglycerate dehydrogenase, partial [uncultured Thermomicrobiales bacterium]
GRHRDGAADAGRPRLGGGRRAQAGGGLPRRTGQRQPGGGHGTRHPRLLYARPQRDCHRRVHGRAAAGRDAEARPRPRGVGPWDVARRLLRLRRGRVRAGGKDGRPDRLRRRRQPGGTGSERLRRRGAGGRPLRRSHPGRGRRRPRRRVARPAAARRRRQPACPADAGDAAHPGPRRDRQTAPWGRPRQRRPRRPARLRGPLRRPGFGAPPGGGARRLRPRAAAAWVPPLLDAEPDPLAAHRRGQPGDGGAGGGDGRRGGRALARRRTAPIRRQPGGAGV